MYGTNGALQKMKYEIYTKFGIIRRLHWAYQNQVWGLYQFFRVWTSTYILYKYYIIIIFQILYKFEIQIFFACHTEKFHVSNLAQVFFFQLKVLVSYIIKHVS